MQVMKSKFTYNVTGIILAIAQALGPKAKLRSE